MSQDREMRGGYNGKKIDIRCCKRISEKQNIDFNRGRGI